MVAAVLLFWQEFGSDHTHVIQRISTTASLADHAVVTRQPVLAPMTLEQPEGRPPRDWHPHRPQATERQAEAAPPATGPGKPTGKPESRAMAPRTPASQHTADVRSVPRTSGGGDGRSCSGGACAGNAGEPARLPRGLRVLKPLPPVYLDHLAFMDKHPGNGKTNDVDSWKKGIGGYDRGLGSREAELVAIMLQSGWRDQDAPLGLEVKGAPPPAQAAPVLTGNAWHHGRGRCPAACARNGGVCLPPLGRCDCPRHRWGPTCEVLVQPAVARPERFHGWCVYNDSSPWFCDKPLCTKASPVTRKLMGRKASCVGRPVEECPQGCSGRGVCRAGGSCQCYPHWRGAACNEHVPFSCISDCMGRGECDTGWCRCREPYYGVDCSLSPPPAPPPPQPKLSPYHLGVAKGAATP